MKPRREFKICSTTSCCSNDVINNLLITICFSLRYLAILPAMRKVQQYEK